MSFQSFRDENWHLWHSAAKKAGLQDQLDLYRKIGLKGCFFWLETSWRCSLDVFYQWKFSFSPFYEFSSSILQKKTSKMKKFRIMPCQFFRTVSLHYIIVKTIVTNILIFLVISLKVSIKIWQVLFWPLGFNLRPLNKNEHKKCQLKIEWLKIGQNIFLG